MFPWKLGHSWLELHYGWVFNFVKTNERSDRVPKIVAQRNSTRQKTPSHSKHQTAKHAFLFCFILIITRPGLKWRKPVNARLGQPPSRVNFSEGLYEKKAVPFACAKRIRARSVHLTFTELTRGMAEPKVFIWRKVGPPRKVTQPPQKDDQVRRVTLRFCFSWKQFAKFCKKMYEKLAGRG